MRYDTFTGILQGLQLNEPQYTCKIRKLTLVQLQPLDTNFLKLSCIVAVSMRGSVCAVLTELQFVSIIRAQNYHITNKLLFAVSPVIIRLPHH